MSTPVTVLPITWKQNSYSVFGVRPQEALNEQLVAVADFGIAMFANRLGTPTGVAESGTAEEIDALHAAGKHVSILRNTVAPMQSGLAASEERVRLETYLDKMIKDGLALIDEYASRDGLARRLENMLAAQAKKAAADVPSAGINEQELDRLLENGYRLSAASDATSAVWPTTEYDHRLTTDTRFGNRTLTFWYLVITNKTGRPVRNVRFRYVTPDGEPDQSFHVGDPQVQPVAFMPPDGKARFQIDQSPNSSRDSLCVVTWEDELGEHETPPITIRTV